MVFTKRVRQAAVYIHGEVLPSVRPLLDTAPTLAPRLYAWVVRISVIEGRSGFGILNKRDSEYMYYNAAEARY